MIRLLAGLLLAIAGLAPVAGEEAWPGWRGKARHVVIAVSDGARNQTDLAVTIAWLAGIALPGSPGQRMDELLERGQ